MKKRRHIPSRECAAQILFVYHDPVKYLLGFFKGDTNAVIKILHAVLQIKP